MHLNLPKCFVSRSLLLCAAALLHTACGDALQEVSKDTEKALINEDLDKTPPFIAVAGTAEIGQTLEVSLQDFTPEGWARIVIWYRSGQRIFELTANRYTLAPLDAGKRIKASVQYIKGDLLSKKAYTEEVPVSRLIQTFKGHTGAINDIAVTQNSAQFISASGDESLKLWDMATGRVLATFEGHNDIVTSVDLSRDDTRAISASDDKQLILWDIPNGVIERKFDIIHTEPINSVVFSKNGFQALSASDDYKVILWDVATGDAIRILGGHTNRVNFATLSQSGEIAVSASDDHTVILWDVARGVPIHTFRGHTGEVNRAIFSPDETHILSVSSDKTARLWSIESQKQIAQFIEVSELTTVAYVPDGTFFLTDVLHWKTMRLIETASKKRTHTFQGHQKDVLSLCIFNHGKRVLSGSADRTVKLWLMP